jgi:branched-chain amino acid transport system permease protein
MIGSVLQLLISGIAMGCIYGLVGIEYTLVWNSTGLINFAHDKLIMLGAYVFAGTFIVKMGVNPIIGVLATLIVMFLFGSAVAIGIFNPLRNKPTIFAVMGTVLLGRVISEAVRLIWGPTPFTLPTFLHGIVHIGNIVVATANIWIIVVSAVLVIGLTIFFRTTRTGKAMRCVQHNKTAAALMGIDVTRNIIFTIGLSAMVCTLIGIMVIPLFTIDGTIGSMIGLKGFASGLVGGFGYLPGTVVGGIIIGIVENMSTIIIPATYKDVVAFILMVSFLLIEPSGLLGHGKNQSR